MRAIVVVSSMIAAAALGLVGVVSVGQAQQVQQVEQGGDTRKADGGGATSLPACVGITTQARYVPYGYNHVVIVKNGCSKLAKCSVATDVNPQSMAVEVTPNATVEVLTFTASPAQTFTARVGCTLH